MTSLHHRDHDLHNKQGGHLAKPPRNHPDPDAWTARLRRHEMAHEMTVKAPPPRTATTPRPSRPRRDSMDPWLADTADRINAVLGPRIRDLLRQHGIKQEQLANDLGLHLSTLADRLANRKAFTLAEGLYLEQFFGIPLEELLEG